MAFITIYDASSADEQSLSEKLKSADHHWVYKNEPISEDNLLPESEVISIFVTSEVTANIMEKLPKLRLVACRSTGFNNVDIKYCENKGITVVNVPSYGEHTVAEYTVGLMLSLTRKLLSASLAVSRGSFSQHDLMGIDLYGKTLGIIGAGKIGQNVASIAKGFGMDVIAYDPYPSEEAAEKLGYKYVELNELLEASDVITIHSPYVGTNKHLINSEAISRMKDGVLIVNTSRGELIDTKAILAALDNKKIGGIALDVFEGEKIITVDEELMLLRKDNLPGELLEQSIELLALEKMSNVILSPHNAYNTEEAIERINATTANNIIDFLSGNAPNAVKADKIKRQNGKLIVIRHGESEWNSLGKWTGTTDVHLSEKGFHESSLYGQELKKTDIKIDYAYCSEQIRTLETLEGILNSSQQFDVGFERAAAINERDYGEYTGKNKWEMKELIGDDKFNKIRRSWDYPVPGGETLKTVYERVQPFYSGIILPRLLRGENILIVAHGNSIRALTKFIEDISDEDIARTEMIFGTIVIYEVESRGKKINKKTLSIDSDLPPA